ncbi:cell division protein ZapE [Pantoea sp. Nvir]|uniref:cell division protein ZapE n=1 Tax=Pantoea sp. Nvir TaxID=2576760 RepID=UPI00135CA452|nr:cell division protein ZapE [Pantoea sp. Nvir]MXP66458.1 AFG1 family ATPase [Pantoea sp. Nvir]CAJ0993390.1 Cell division protein ZapE [Pantoea sp. Nvir]
MQTSSLLAYYERALLQGDYKPDNVQREAVTKLNAIQKVLVAREPDLLAHGKKRLFSCLSWLIGKKKNKTQQTVRGFYMWGGVGRGKTWIMDLFFHSIPGNRKLRLHFHRFMLRVHKELTQLQGQIDPLLTIADNFKAETDILCFDEFFASDIADAMLLGTLMEALFERGITLVATSNVPPEDFYRDGLQRDRFLPVIEKIKQYCDVMNVDAGIDYRLHMPTVANLWNFPLNEATNAKMERMFKTLAGRSPDKVLVLEINHRQITTLGVSKGVMSIDFMTLCGEGRSQHDYIEISRCFHSVLLYNVPVMISETEEQARRFLMLVDELYEHNVKLVVAAEMELLDIYQGRQLKLEYQRCLSRLQEMQSKEYFYLPHLP